MPDDQALEQEGRHEHHVRLAIGTHSGNFSHEFKAHDLLQYAADLAAEHFHMTLPPGDVWELHHGERLLNLNETIHQAHLHSGEELTLTAKEFSVHLIVETASGSYAHDFRPRDWCSMLPTWRRSTSRSPCHRRTCGSCATASGN